MQFNLSFIILGVAGLTSALPIIGTQNIAVRDAQPHASEAQIEVKREEAQELVTETVEIHVDENGTPIFTTTRLGVPATPAPIPKSDPPSTTGDSQVTTNAKAQEPQQSNETPASGGHGQGDLSGSSFQKGVTWGVMDDSKNCKSPDQLTSEVKELVGKGYDLIRLYTLACKGPETLQAAVAGTNTWMFLGLDDISQASSLAGQLASALNNKWNNVHTVSVGNEVGDFGGAAAAVDAARSTLRAAGYQGPVVTAGTCQNMATNAQICSTSDYCAANCHTFWDGDLATNSGTSIKAHIDGVKTTNPGKNVIVTEAGWPTCGSTIPNSDPNRASQGIASVPGKSQQGEVISHIASDFSPTNVIHFSAFNEGWKDPGQWNAERCWGMY